MIKGLYEAHLPVSDMRQSIEFYQKLGLELAYESGKVSFVWIEKGRSWLGLWEADEVNIPYHASIRHIAFHVEVEDIIKAKEWLKEREVEVREAFGFSAERQPIVLPNNPQAHACLYFDDPDGNSLEFIAPLRLDHQEEFEMMTLEEWMDRRK
ncbi:MULTISPECIES: VOC family protein [Rossellomorea]|jgi:catechol 2,3-dioxygenase-like lactoylglutathione lyase family enzyme|uniref:VOC family protein n=1 Tax=Rossellomorea TaxID=2837508 RepID=UPI0011E8BF1A|nr:MULTISPECIES: VOC family protein [Rossellomorea]MDT9025702.1 VOC family protein [Rossellomorea sp. YC4-1]TYS89992.1 VOC family protein [Rossellomorea aquimaris]